MQYSKYCDNCQSVPIPFDIGNSESDSFQKGYFMAVDRSTLDASVLMSSGALVWRICPVEIHPIDDETAYWCDKCFAHIVDEGEDPTENPAFN